VFSQVGEYGDLKQIEDETIHAIRKLIGEGKARFLGVSGYPLKALRLLGAAPGVDIVLTYNHYSLNDTTLLSALPEFQKRNLGIINAGGLSQGLPRRSKTRHGLPVGRRTTDYVRT
jgi:aryl-alcohol dehydrogenase-like predicted oxidoreductase